MSLNRTSSREEPPSAAEVPAVSPAPVVTPGLPSGPLDMDSDSPPVEREAAEDESKYPTGLQFYMIVLSVAVVLLLGAMDAGIVSTAVPSITDEYHTVADVGWYAAAYRLCTCSFQFMFGKIYKTFSFKKVFLTSNAVFIVGSVLCASAPTSMAFVLGRAVCGLASAGLIAGCFTLLVLCLPLRKRPLYTGILGAVEGLASIASPILGGIIVDRLGWRWCFWICVPLGFVTEVTLFFCLSDFTLPVELTWAQRLAELDLIGNLVFVPSLTCLFLALTWAGSKYAWNSPTVIGLFGTFAVLLGVFAWEQYRKGDAGTLPPRILLNRSVLAGFIFTLCTSSALNVVEYYLPTYFQAVREYSASESGYLLFPTVFGLIVGIILQGAGVSIVGYYAPFMFAGSILMPIFSGLMTTLAIDTPLAVILVYSGFYGFAAGIGFQSPQSAVQTALPVADASIGLSTILFAQQFGPAVFVAAAQSIFTNRLSKNLHELAPSLNATTIEAMGITDLKTLIGPENLNGVLLGFDKSLIQTWYLAVGLTCATVVGTLSMEWKSVKQKQS